MLLLLLPANMCMSVVGGHIAYHAATIAEPHDSVISFICCGALQDSNMQFNHDVAINPAC